MALCDAGLLGERVLAEAERATPSGHWGLRLFHTEKDSTENGTAQQKRYERRNYRKMNDLSSLPEMTIGERIREMREERGWTRYRLEKESGLTQTQIAAIEKGETPNPTIGTLEKLASAFGTGVDELRGRAPAISLVVGENHDDFRPVHSHQVPIVAIVAGGNPAEAELVQDEEYALLSHLYSPSRYVIRLFGDSMWPTYHSGDLLLVDRKEKVKDGDSAVVRVEGDSTVKRVFRKRKGQGLILKADNPTFPPIETDEEDVEIIAKVLKIVEGERR